MSNNRLPNEVVFTIEDSEKEVRHLSFTGPQRQLRFGAEDGLYSDSTQFVVERFGSDGLVHIRSRYNNYYWARASRHEPWLVASSPERVEDMFVDECTLFWTHFSAGNVSVSFVHAQSGFNVVMRPQEDAYAYNLCLDQAPPTNFSFVSLIALRGRKLPRYVAFQNRNDRYLIPRLAAPMPMFFDSETTNNRSTGFDIEHTKSGEIRVKPMRSNGMMGAIPDSTQWRAVLLLDPRPNDPTTLFEVYNHSRFKNGIRLRCNGINTRPFCSSSADRALILSSNSTSETTANCLRVNPVAQQGTRRVTIESFRHPWESRYIIAFHGVTIHNTTNAEREHLLIEPDISMETHFTFRNSLYNHEGPSAKFHGRIPFPTTSGQLEFPDVARTVDSEWQKSQLTVVKRRYEATIILPPNTNVEVLLFYKRVLYEIPFSYQQFDTIPFGGNVTQHLHDGYIHIQHDADVEHQTYNFHNRTAHDISSPGVESPPGSGIFVHELECPKKQDGVETDEPDQEYDAQADMGPDDGLDHQEVDAPVGIETDACDEVTQEV
ncbi:hypothetical protein RND81_14G218300 [Saponaria officinalis]|uniref:Agglutinin domain-containing protein n=1 Tax=Saponaria officinalis TaxID=3572 RepID=A0AAW1GSI2_SAPOF